MNFEELVEVDLIDHEGYRRSAYQDHLGYWTIGIGRLIDRRKKAGLSLDEARYLLRNDIAWCVHCLRDKLSWFDDAPHGVRRALVNMCFQMGVEGLLRFRKTLSLIEKGRYSEAANEALRSQWARQTPDRAGEVVSWIRSAKHVEGGDT